MLVSGGWWTTGRRQCHPRRRRWHRSAPCPGEPLGSYGNNSINGSTAQGNAHYGIEVQGGLNITLERNTIIGDQMGIVVTKGTQTISISDNSLEQQNRAGISLIDGVSKATVAGNMIDGAATGVYVRNSVVNLSRNTIGGASLHAITLIGSDSGSVVEHNTLGGAGVSALDTSRASGNLTLGKEYTAGWDDTKPLLKRVAALVRPLTVVWLCIFTMLCVAAYRNWRTRTGKGKRHDRRRAELAPGRHPYTNRSVLRTAAPKTLEEVLAESERRMLMAGLVTVGSGARPKLAPAYQWRPEPAGAGAGADEAATATASAAAENRGASAHHETVLLSAIREPKAEQPAADTLVAAGVSREARAETEGALDFPSFGDIAGDSARRRSNPSAPTGPKTPEGAESEKHQS